MEHNRLNEQKEKAPQVGQIRGAAHNQRWTDLLADFAGLNQIKPSAEFTLDALKRNLRSGGSWGKTYQWPGCDHPSFYKRNQRAALTMAEPYNLWEVEVLRAYAVEKGLILHSPPNEFASFWYPGFTRCIAITREDFGPVKWLPEQIDFDAY